MQFVKALPEDKQEILALYRSLAGTPYCAWTEDYPGEPEIDGDLSRNALYCLKDDKGEILGTISLDDDEEVDSLPCWSKELQPGAELSRLGVKVEYQNQGIAKCLFLQGMDVLREQGKKSVHVIVCQTNEKALRAYAPLALNNVGECELFGEKWWCFEKKL